METKARNILLIEDDQFLSSLLKTKLEKLGYVVQAIYDGLSALDYLKDNKPDLILLDIILPGLSGFEVLKKIKDDAKTKPIPVIIISNLGQEEDVKIGKEMGAVEYFIKAKISIDDLVKKISEYIK